MKKLLVLLTILLVAGSTNAQTYVFQNMDHTVADGFWDMANLYNNQGDATAKWDVTDVTTGQKEGAGCVQLDYKVGAGDGWGGYIVRTSIKPLPNNQVFDLSTGTHLTFWYKVVSPVVMTSPGAIVMEFKICDILNGAENRVFREVPVDFTDASGQWKQATVDFTMGTDKSISWAYQAQDGDREMAWDHVNGFEWAVVYVPGTGGSATNTPTASGTILLDGFSITGDHYPPPFVSFESMASQFGIDDMGWAGATDKGSVTLTDNSTDVVEGTTGSLQFDYTCNASQDWGGFVAFDLNVTPPDKFVERTALTVFIKNKTACTTSVPARAIVRVFLFEDDGEQWITKVPIDLTTTSDWTRYRLPLKQTAYSTNGDQYPPVGAFGLNPNGAKGNETFNQEKVNKIRIEVLAVGVGPDAGPKGEKLTGTLLFGMMQNSGYQVYDIVAPAAPANVSVVKGNYSNLISWSDVSNEGTEKYYVYASKSPITDINAKGVEQVAGGIARGVQVYEHLIRTPLTDKDVTYYYAVNAIDKAGNIGAVATTAGTTNTAKGIPTIYHGTVNFKADGDLSEWKAAGITPFKLYPSKGSAHIMNNFKVDNDADLSTDVYVALDNNYLYVAYDVTDDIVYADDDKYMSTGYSWALDACELELGLYNQQASQHTAYQRGSYPDYHIRFNKVRARQDHWTAEKDSLLLPGPDYYWQEKFPTGYTVEARVALDHLANWRKSNTMTRDTIGTLIDGMKIPFDIVLGDNDGKNSTDLGSNREGQISWSPFNNDNGWWGPQYWMYTWLGNTDVTDVKEEALPFTYTLSQNYPNPFNPTTQIKYSISKVGNVSLKIYDVLGRVVSDLVNQEQQPGNYSVRFDASKLASGVYFYRIESGSFVSVKKMMLVK